MYHAYLINPSGDGGLSPLDAKQLCDALVDAGASWTGRPNEYAWNYAGLGPARIKVRRQVVDLLVQLDPAETLAARVAISLRFALEFAQKFDLVLFDPQVGKVIDPRDVEAIERVLDPEMLRKNAFASLEEEVFALALPEPSAFARAVAGLRNGLDLLKKAASSIPLLGALLSLVISVAFFPVYIISWLFEASRQARAGAAFACIGYLLALVAIPLAIHGYPEIRAPIEGARASVYGRIAQYYLILNAVGLVVRLIGWPKRSRLTGRTVRLMRAMTTPL